jgi:low temperature requirement protein LtrA
LCNRERIEVSVSRLSRVVERWSLLRPAGRDDGVTPLELFFDLVYVFAISQLSHHLLAYQTWIGAAETFVLFVPVFLIWLRTTWTTTLLDTDRRPVQWMLLLVMLMGLFMNAAIGSAVAGSAWLFVGAYLAIQIGRDVWLLTTKVTPFIRDHWERMLVWTVAGGALWVAGALAGPETRLAWWAGAAAIDLAGTALAHPLPGRGFHWEDQPLARDRLFERTRLFFIIALGETILTTGTAVAAHIEEPLTLVTGAVALVGSVALWWTYFDAREAEAHATLRAAADPARVSVQTFNALFVVVAALIVVAVGDEAVIAHPLGDSSVTTVVLLYAGPILYLGTHAWYSWRVNRLPAPSRLIGVGALVVLGCLSPLVPPFVAALGAAAPLVGVAIADGRHRFG